ncbi:hypothetical protein [Fusobacterium necrophorum]|uniref:Uncharacterized protein n=1 Tax=Fusobacterium necrophorum subsp. funduliforme TaxID=143387 RepID=A0A162J7P3_9FUSO|nr:hypothetical protein [Fusobacterium necrophorum]KYL05288.1 hypothetical protein A2J07_00705 [Fusobacterium necrophorum subsp. funduliforme]MDK4523113.1 hypothetical protein [Fusobacterium necrophorum]
MKNKEEIQKLILDFKITSERIARETSKFKDVERKFQKEAKTFLEKQKINLNLLNGINEKLAKYLKEKNEKL